MSAEALNVTAADRGFTWSDEETLILLQLWSNIYTQSEISNNNKKNYIIYEKISGNMNNIGFIRTASQCKEKIKRMKREYTITKQGNRNGKNKKTMRFYEQFDKVLQDIQNKNSENVNGNTRLDSALINELKVDDAESSQSERKLRNIAPKPEIPKFCKKQQPVENGKLLFENKETSNPWTPDVVLVEEEPQPTSSKILNSTSTISKQGESTLKKRKLNSELSLCNSMMDSLTSKFIKYQTKSDEKLLSKIEELEMEHIAMDTRIQKMWLDFEERRQNDEREHGLNMISTFQDILSKLKNGLAPK